MLVLGGVFIALGLVSDGAYATVAGSLGHRLGRNVRYRRWRRRVSGTVTVGLGVALAGSDA